MADFFDFNFNVVPDAQNSSSGSGSYDNNETGRVINNPESYFFTEPGFKQIASNKAFGPVSENEFQITTTFNSNKELKAYAVTSGTLFYAQFGSSENTVNIILKPTKDVGLGLKIKYFVYRGIKADDIFVTNNGVTSLKGKDDNILDFLTKVWYEYIEYNDTEDDFTGDKIGYISASATSADILKQFFAKDKHNLLHVAAGTHIGNFIDSGGFEIVLDEGDFGQEKSDTGLLFDESFARATECILKVDGTYPAESYIFGGNSLDVITNQPIITPKIFRENIYKFLDPAAFYGAHVTINSGSNKGTIFIKNSASYSDPKNIFEKIVGKFLNKQKTYLYVKDCNNRSYNFHESVLKPLKINSVEDTFDYDGWPIKCLEDKFNYSISFENISTTNCAVFCNLGISSSTSTNGFYGAKELLIDSKIPTSKSSVLFNIPNSANIPFSSIIYLSYTDETNVLNKFFGIINLKTIFEKEDFRSARGSYVNHLRPILIKDGTDIGFYQTKLVLEGDYISSSNPPEIPPETTPEQLALLLSKNLRTYILFPQKTTSKNKSFIRNNLTAGYYNSPKDNEEYCKVLYGEGEIWRGIITDNGTDVFSLIYRRKDNDEEMPVYQLGISEFDYKTLTSEIESDATNLFFVFEDAHTPTNSSFLRNNLKIKYDRIDGTTLVTTAFISVYTIDGYFFYTKEYSTNFNPEYCKEFANIAVDFSPYNLSSFNNGYECGFDFAGFDGRDKYKDIVGNYFNSSGVPENDSNFKPVTLDYLRLLAKNYNAKPSNWRSIPISFHTDSFITLYSGISTTVQCRITKVASYNPNAALFFRYNSKYISIDDVAAIPEAMDTIVSKKIISIVDHTITVKALQKFEKDQIIEVISMDGRKEQTAGKLYILANKYISEIEILLVNCQTRIKRDTSPIKEGLIAADKVLTEQILTNFLKQIYTTPKFTSATLDLSSDENFKIDNDLYIFLNQEVMKSTNTMFNYCFNLLSYANKSCSLVLFFFDELGALVKPDGTQGIGLNGEAYDLGGAQGARVFRGGLRQNTIPHEALHSLGLYHSFDIDGEYTFRKTSNPIGDYANGTDNVMDYFSSGNDKKRKLIWKWQMKRIYNTGNNGKLMTKYE